MPDDGYDTSLIDLALAARNHCESSAVVPWDEAALLVNEHQQTAPADEGSNVTKWNYVMKIFNLQQQTARSDGSSENTERSSQHRLVHLPKTTKFLGTQIVASKCAYPQFACRGGCGKCVRTYCPCSPGQIICNECFVPHTVKCDAEAAAEAALSC